MKKIETFNFFKLVIFRFTSVVLRDSGIFQDKIEL